MVELFQSSLLLAWLVEPYATVLAFFEFFVGLLLILGLFTHKAAIAGAVLMIVLIFGFCLVEQWDWVGFQTLHALIFYLLIVKGAHNTIEFDRRRKL